MEGEGERVPEKRLHFKSGVDQMTEKERIEQNGALLYVLQRYNEAILGLGLFN